MAGSLSLKTLVLGALALFAADARADGEVRIAQAAPEYAEHESGRCAGTRCLPAFKPTRRIGVMQAS